jgi:serine/threonine-protein kinase
MSEPLPDTTPENPSDPLHHARPAAALGPDSQPAQPHSTSVSLRDPLGDGSGPPLQPSSSELPPSGRAGRNLLFGEIARGGMGAVLRGRDPALGRELAVKVLLEAHRDRPELVQRFLEEAQIGGQLQHPGVVPVYELGRFADDRPFFTMKLVKGQTLAKLLAQRAAPHDNLPRLLTIFEQVCQTVAYAHARGVIHRDLKPSNVMVGAFGEVQVMDWGMAKVLPTGGAADEPSATPAEGTVIQTARSRSGSDLSQAGTVLGTAAFMPPEQASGEIDRIDERADVFGLGAILSVLLTGKPPYVGKDSGEVHRKAMRGDLADAYARLEESGADAPLIALGKACLAAERDYRPRDAGEVAWRVAAYQADVQQRLRQAELERAAAQARAAEERKRRKLAVGLAASVLALAVAGGAGAWGLVHWRSDTDSRINLVLNDASARRATALAAGEGETALAAWTEAETTARRLEDLLAQGFPSAEMRQRVRDWVAALDEAVAAVRRQAAEAERYRHLLARLTEARAQKEDEVAKSTIEADYRAAFASYGLDVDVLTTEEAARLLSGRPETELMEVAAALDDWALERRRLQRPEAEWRRLVALARALDPDVWRDALRALDPTDNARQRSKLLELAQTANVSRLPPASVELLGRALRQAGELKKAEEVLRQGQRHYPKDVWLNYKLAEVLKAQDPPQWDEAIRFYTAARSVRPEIGHDLGHALQERGRQEEALAVFEELTRLRPDNPEHHYCLGRALLAKGQLDEAIQAYQEALHIDPKFAPAHSAIGSALLAKGQLDEAIREYRTAIAVDPKYVWAHYNLGLALQDKGQLDEAIQEFRAALAINPKNASAYYNLGNALFGKGQLDEAINEYRQAIELAPKNVLAHGSLGRALRAKGQLDEAIRAYHEALRLDPKNATAHNNLGVTLFDKGQLDEAINEYRQAITLDPKYSGAHNNLGNALKAKGQLDEAIGEFHEALRLNPKLSQVHNNLGNALKDKGQLDEAIKEYHEAIRLDPKNALAHIGLGNALQDKGQLDEAIKAYREALRLDPKDATAHNNLGNALKAKGQLDEALKEYREALRLAPKLTPAHFNLGILLQAKGQLDEAINEYRTALNLDSKSASPHSNLGIALWAKGERDEAIKEFRAALDLDPKLAPAHNNLGYALQAKGELDEAIKEFRAALDLDPKYATARTNLLQAERLLQLESKLGPILDGKAKSANATESLALAQYCQKLFKKLNAASARLYAEAFAHDAKLADDMQQQHRYNAACAAALAGCGQGKDADQLDDKERARMRHQALDWLKADLAHWTKQAASDKPQERTTVQQRMKHWLADADFVGVRGQDALAKLPEAERDSWHQLWDEVAAVLKRASEPR